MPNDTCDFCLVHDQKTTKYFQDIHGQLPHTLSVVGLPDGFTVLQDLVPIAEQGGHVLLIPNDHFISLAVVEDQVGLAAARDTIVRELRMYFPHQALFFFEHGAGYADGEPIGCGGCHMDHAHGHILVLPSATQFLHLQTKLEMALAENGWIGTALLAIQLDEIFTGIFQVAGTNPYIHIAMIGSDNNTLSCAFVQKSPAFVVPSQLLRMIVSDIVYNKVDSSYWHWMDVHLGLSSPERIRQVKEDVLLFRHITGF